MQKKKKYFTSKPGVFDPKFRIDPMEAIDSDEFWLMGNYRRPNSV